MSDAESGRPIFLTAHEMETLDDDQLKALTRLVGESELSPRLETLLDGLENEQRDALMRMGDDFPSLIEPILARHSPTYLAGIRSDLVDLPPPGADRIEAMRRIFVRANDTLFEAIRADLVEAIAADAGPGFRPG